MARLDTGWHSSSKVLSTGVYGMALHAWSISFCDAARSDGFVPHGAWPALLQRGVSMLVGAHLWEPTEGGFQLHDYTDYNRTREQIEAEQADTRERVQRHRSRNGASNPTRNGVTSPVTPPVSNGVPLARAGAPGPGPGVTRSVTPGTPPTPSTDVEAQGGSAPRLDSPPTEQAAVVALHDGGGICPFCRLPYTGNYLDHTAEKHKVNKEPADLSRPKAPPPEVEAEFVAAHQRLAEKFPEVGNAPEPAQC
jgi:hypothetical protein